MEELIVTCTTTCSDDNITVNKAHYIELLECNLHTLERKHAFLEMTGHSKSYAKEIKELERLIEAAKG